jgi:hypothetical protein
VRENPVTGPGADQVFESWVKSQIDAGDVSFDRIVDRKVWPSAPVPNVTAVLGTERRPQTGPIKYADYVYVPFVLLAQGEADGKSSLKSLGVVLTDLGTPVSLNVAPVQIREDEYAFGATYREGIPGNKSGFIADIMSLYRYHDGELKEIFRDVVWMYSKYSDWQSNTSASSCNVDLRIVPQPSDAGPDGFFRIARELQRSYFSDAKNPQFGNPALPEVPADCSLVKLFQKPEIHTWDTTTGIYVDHRGRFLQADDLYKGWPFP